MSDQIESVMTQCYKSCQSQIRLSCSSSHDHIHQNDAYDISNDCNDDASDNSDLFVVFSARE